MHSHAHSWVHTDPTDRCRNRLRVFTLQFQRIRHGVGSARSGGRGVCSSRNNFGHRGFLVSNLQPLIVNDPHISDSPPPSSPCTGRNGGDNFGDKCTEKLMIERSNDVWNKLSTKDVFRIFAKAICEREGKKKKKNKNKKKKTWQARLDTVGIL